MQRLRQSTRRIGHQLGQVPTTARLLIGAMMVILVMALILVAQFTGRTNMVPLGVTREANVAAVRYLDASGIDYQEQDGEIYVPAQRHDQILGQLTEREVVTGEQLDFNKLISESSPFRSRQQNEQAWLVAKMNMLSGMISHHHAIDRARVILSPSRRAGLGASYVPPTAAVSITTTRGDLTPEQVDAIANLVAGSEAALAPENVQIINARTSRSYEVLAADSRRSSQYHDLKVTAEDHVRKQIAILLGHIPGVSFAVNAMVDNTTVTGRSKGYEEAFVAPDIDETVSEQVTEQSTPTEPGVRPNVPIEVSTGSTNTRTKSFERSRSDVESRFPNQDELISDPKGYPLKINATVLIPRGYFVAIYRTQRNDVDAEPDQSVLDVLVANQVDRVKRFLTPIIDTLAFSNARLGTVVVDMIPDIATVAQGPGGLGGGGGGGGGGGAGDGGLGGLLGPGGALQGGMLEKIGLGSLALVALAMMFFMVKRASTTDELPSAAEVAGIPPTLASSDGDLIGEAEEADVALEGIELHDDDLKRQRMLDQITSMVEESPDDAANLLRRWIVMDES